MLSFLVNRVKKIFHSEFRFTLYIHITLGGVFHCPCHCFNCCPLYWDPTLTKHNKTDLSNGEINGYFNKFRLKAEICLDMSIKGAVSRNSAKLVNYKMPFKLRET